eukprot:gene1216-1554_t
MRALRGLRGLRDIRALRGIEGVERNEGFKLNEGIEGNEGFEGIEGDEGFEGIEGNEGFEGIEGFERNEGIEGNEGFEGFEGNEGNEGNEGFEGNEGNEGFEGNEGNEGFEGIVDLEYEAHQQDKCPVCRDEYRFEWVQLGNRHVLQPRWWMIVFDNDMVLQQLYANPDWVSAQDPNIPTPAADLQNAKDNGTFYGGSWFRQLVQKQPQLLEGQVDGMLEMSLDWANPHKTKQYDVGVFGLRSRSRNNLMLNKGSNYVVKAIIPGPSIPSRFRPFLLAVVKDFKQFKKRPQHNRVEVTRLEYKPSSADHRDAGAVESSAAVLSPVLVGSAADAPARCKQSSWQGVASYLSCGFCLQEAERLASASGQPHNYQKGYEEPSPQTLRFNELDYFDYTCMFPLPTFHMLLYGLCRDFWGYTLRIAARGRSAAAADSVGVVSNEQRRLIIAALLMLVVTSDFGRPPKDVCKHFGLMQLEDWLHFAETLAPLVMIPDEQGVPVLPAIAMEHSERPFTEATRRSAAESLLQYAKGLSRYGYPNYMNTCNLHCAVCQLYQQESRRGATGADGELWGERVIQKFKVAEGGRVRHHVEQKLRAAFDSTAQGCGVYSFNQADKANDEILSSSEYGRATRRINHYVQVSYAEGVEQQIQTYGSWIEGGLIEDKAFRCKIHVYRYGNDERVSTISYHENVSTAEGLLRQLCRALGAENATQLTVVQEEDDHDDDAAQDAAEGEDEEDEDATEDQAPPTVMDAVDVCNAIVRNAKSFFDAPPVGKAYDQTSLALSFVCHGAKEAQQAEQRKKDKVDPGAWSQVSQFAKGVLAKHVKQDRDNKFSTVSTPAKDGRYPDGYLLATGELVKLSAATHGSHLPIKGITEKFIRSKLAHDLQDIYKLGKHGWAEVDVLKRLLSRKDKRTRPDTPASSAEQTSNDDSKKHKHAGTAAAAAGTVDLSGDAEDNGDR